jgi:hypothetical protein
MKSQSISYLLNESECIYKIWNLEGEVHSIWDSWVSGLQEYTRAMIFSKLGGRASFFGRVQKMKIFWRGSFLFPNIPKKFVGGHLTSSEG